MSSDKAIKVQGIGVYFPKHEDERALDFARHSTAEALQHAGLDPTEVDLVVLCTRALSEEPLEGADAMDILLEKLGLPAASGARVKLLESCSGGLRGLQLALQAMRSDGVKHPLIIGADPRFDVVTRDVLSCGAAALVLGLGRDGAGPMAASFDEAIEVPDGDFQRIECPAVKDCPGRAGVFQLEVAGDGPASARGWVDKLRGAIDRALARAGITLQDVKHCVFHQMGTGEERWYEALGISEAQISQRGGESAYLGCSIFTSLGAAVEAGNLEAGDIVLLSSVAPRDTWEAMVWRW